MKRQRPLLILSLAAIAAFAFAASGVRLAAGKGAVPGVPKAPAGPPPGPEPAMVGEGVISTPDDEFGATFSPDGLTILYCKSVPRSQFYVILESHWEKGRWGAPRIAPFSGYWRDSDPVFSRDGRRVYFASDRPVNGVDKKNFDIWWVPRTEKGWGEPVNMGPPINSDRNEDFISFTGDGTAYFTSGREGSAGGLDVWRSRVVGGKYAEPENLGTAINRKEWFNIEAWMSEDESLLLVGGFGHTDGPGNSDILVSYRTNGVWGELKPLGPKVNTTARDYSPRISLDGKSLFFSSERGMPSDPRSAPWTAAEFEKASTSVRNGLGNIYRIRLEDALAGTR
jgi:hypothetical protein